MKYYDVRKPPFVIYGAFYDEKEHKYCRMPHDVAKKVSENVEILATNTSGGRIRFSTDSRYISIKLTYPKRQDFYHIPKLGMVGVIMLEETENETHFAHSFVPNNLKNYQEEEKDDGFIVTVDLNKREKKNYILYLPTYNDVTSIEVGLDDDAYLGEGKKYKDISPILYYGSSITQGACASRVDIAYPSLVSRWNNVDYINLGMSGSALAEDEMIEYISKIDCSLFVCDYDYNAPTANHLRKTHWRLYEAFRLTHPNTPVLFLSAIYMSTFPELEERVSVIKETYQKALLRGDNVYFLDGRDFFDKEDKDLMTVEGLHPNDLGLYFMAKGVYKKISKIDIIFK